MGDVSDSLQHLEDTLQLLVRRFATVFFIPGNHDLWCGDGPCGDSLAKLQEIRRVCDQLGVVTTPKRISGSSEGSGEKGVVVCPLFSWHHKSFDVEPDLEGRVIPPVHKAMCDFQLRNWPGLSMLDDSVAACLDRLNDETETTLNDIRESSESEPLVTFSHFLPEPELLLEKRFLTMPSLPKASLAFSAKACSALGTRYSCFWSHTFRVGHAGEWCALHTGPVVISL